MMETDPIKKAAIKLMIVTVYGVLGSKHSPLNNVGCATAITALGRKACMTAQQLISEGKLGVAATVVCANTDSVTFSVNLKDVVTVCNNWSTLTGAIREALGSGIYRFELEYKKFSLCSLYTQKTKQVLRILVDCNAFTDYIKPQTAAKLKNVPEFVYKLLTSKTTEGAREKLKPTVDFVTAFPFSKVSPVCYNDNHALLAEVMNKVLYAQKEEQFVWCA